MDVWAALDEHFWSLCRLVGCRNGVFVAHVERVWSGEKQGCRHAHAGNQRHIYAQTHTHRHWQAQMHIETYTDVYSREGHIPRHT